MKIMLLTMFTSYLFTVSVNPMLLGIFVILQALFYSALISMNMLSSWYGYILFLIMLGGILILFMFVISITSNQILYVNLNKLFILLLIFTFMLTSKILLTNSKDMMEISNLNLSENENNFFISKVHNFSSMKTTILMILYLFFSMIAIVKMVELKKGSFRSL